ncbi:MAG: hypothetical protein KGJ02_03655 [Verrucomicrobiota bacterium]|nr:hypothetical protein [Verrucomicrobiota bacterium]
MKNGTQLASSLFEKILETKPTRVKQGYGSFITMDFGKDIAKPLKTRTGVKIQYFGEWHLWIYMCAWRIDKDKKPLAGCEDSKEKIEVSLSELASRKLKKVEILNNSFDAKLVFGEDMELYLFSFYTQDKEQWMLFTPENKTFTAGPGSEWSYHDSDKA